MLRYLETYSLSDALREGKRLEEAEKAMEDRCRKLSEEAVARNVEMQEKKQEHREVCAAPQEATAETSKQDVSAAEDPVMHLNFRVWGTREQLMALRQYMIDNHLKFGKVE